MDAIWIGVGLNLLATIGGFIAILLNFERRMTRVETKIDFVVNGKHDQT